MTSLKSIDPLLYSQAGIVRIRPGMSPVPLTSSTVSSAVRGFGLVYLCWLPRLISKRSPGCQGILELGLRLSEVSGLCLEPHFLKITSFVDLITALVYLEVKHSARS